jgi:nucleoside-diphosphate-sugar epimerase
MAVHEVTAVFHLAACDAAALLQAVNLYSRRVPVVTARPSPQLSLARIDGRQQERLSVARFGEVFGPGDRKRAYPANATPADGPARDFVFVRDAARACLLAAEASVANGPGDHTFRSGWVMTERQMAAALRDPSAVIGASDSAPLSNPLGWAPAQTFSDALNETLAWHQKSHNSGNADLLRAAA